MLGGIHTTKHRFMGAKPTTGSVQEGSLFSANESFQLRVGASSPRSAGQPAGRRPFGSISQFESYSSS